MAIIKEDGEIQLECDRLGCKSVTPTYPNSEFKAMLEDAKELGWKIFKCDNKKKFVHFCKWIHSKNQPDEADLL